MGQLIVCLIPGTVKIIGIPTLMEYVFTDTQKILLVDDLDIPDLLSKKDRGGCCGAPREPKNIFQLAE